MTPHHAHDNDIEQAVIGALLCHNEAIEALQADLRAEQFYAEIHQRIYQCIQERREKGIITNPITLKEQFAGALESKYIVSLVSAATSVISLHAYAATIIKLATRRVLQNAAQVVIEAPDATENTELVATLAGALDDANRQILSHRMNTDKHVAAAIAEDLKHGSAYYSTGLPRLDFAMDGGLHEGKLYGIAANSGHGKTMLATTISNHLKKAGVRHLFICAEMGEMETHARSMAKDMDVEVRSFTDESKRDKDFWRKLGEVANAERGDVIYYSDPFLTFDTLRQVVSTAVAKYRIKGFILDYWQLVGGKPARESDANFLGTVAQWEAAACKRHRIFGVNTAQLNRDGLVLGSGGLQRACDQMYFLMRSDETKPDAYLHMGKSRYTPTIHVGDDQNPSMRINKKGGYFEHVPSNNSRNNAALRLK